MKKGFIIGIDISKRKLTIAVLEQGELIDQYEVSNDKNGYRQMNERCDLKDALICLDDCGNYHARLIKYLTDKKCQFRVESGLRIKRSRGIQRGKSDRIDAKAIARYAYIHQSEISFNDRYNLPQPSIKAP